MASANQEYVNSYADAAMEQMRLYGIPASITLAQGILESASGKSQLARNENNHFGIKASKSWLDNGGKYGLYSDDKPNEKFCSYASVSDSYTHHSQILKNSSRYVSCFALSADDYKGWANGLQRAGYASDKRYAQSLIAVIERNGLDKYDKMVLENPQAQIKPQQQVQSTAPTITGDYAFPVKRDEFMLITSPFGLRKDPMNPSQNQTHKGIDIKCNNEAIFATEANGKVVAVNTNANTAGGKSVTVEYAREDGCKMQMYYAHLSSIDVKVGDTVNANQKLGVSGNTGTRTTGPHLHFGVKQVNADGTTRDVDPAAYLAEIAQKGNIQVTAMHNGTDLLAKYKTEQPQGQGQSQGIDTSLSADDWMKKLLSSEDSGTKLGGTGQDPVMDMVMTLFTSLMALAMQIDGKSSEEALAAATDAAINRTIDLSSLVPDQKQCTLSIRDNDTPVLTIGNTTHAMTTAEMNRLNLALSDSSLTAEQKQQRVASVINGIALSTQMSQNYQQSINTQQSQSETFTR
jgi:murein DD-endopeptidase MepM/ murein hydrolase activator NlpD